MEGKKNVRVIHALSKWYVFKFVTYTLITKWLRKMINCQGCKIAVEKCVLRSKADECPCRTCIVKMMCDVGLVGGKFIEDCPSFHDFYYKYIEIANKYRV
jgi:hypothetical protein